jgi:hypothetical protein
MLQHCLFHQHLEFSVLNHQYKDLHLDKKLVQVLHS